MELFIEGHSSRVGYVVGRKSSDDEINAYIEQREAQGCSIDRVLQELNALAKPLRCFKCRKTAQRLIERYNRRFSNK